MKTNKTRSLVILISLLGILVFFTLAVVEKQKIVTNGKIVFLELVPVDPRSLIQGDYMDLKYKIASDYSRAWYQNSDSVNTIPSKNGYLQIKVDSLGVATLLGLYPRDKSDLPPDNYLLKYYNFNQGLFNIGAESFFFQETKAELYEKAKYGALAIDNKGNSVLIGLYDQDLNKIP
ncbi:GDYXXLXY domain-containing protein [Myroides sp. LJL119]